jgi:uncharacterized membrane protein (UPF0127 family)
MQIMNRTRGTLLGVNVDLADSWWSRLRGFLMRPEPRAGEGILLTPCNAIHTWGMEYELDIIFLDASGRVLKVLEKVPPRTTPARVVGGRYVLEVPAGTIEATGTSVGDNCSWTRTPSHASLRLQEI